MNHEPTDRDRALLAELGELGRATPVPNGQAMEARLLAAFTEFHGDAARRRRQDEDAASVPSPAAGWDARVPARRWHVDRRWLNLAAATVIAVAGAIIWYRVPSRLPEPVPQPTRGTAPQPAPGPDRKTTRPVAAPAPAPAPSRPSQPRPQARRAVPADDVGGPFADFVALPGAAGFPDFESGQIVRVEVPVMDLPAYGLDLVHDATPTAIEADFLVGQDGLPRAIRLASTISFNRSRR